VPYFREDILFFLLEKTWIGFDVNKTLHEFRRVSSTAIERVLADVSERHGAPILPLKVYHYKGLGMKTANAFSDGIIASFDCRVTRKAAGRRERRNKEKTQNYCI
jgi:hypothetical protein